MWHTRACDSQLSSCLLRLMVISLHTDLQGCPCLFPAALELEAPTRQCPGSLATMPGQRLGRRERSRAQCLYARGRALPAVWTGASGHAPGWWPSHNGANTPHTGSSYVGCAKPWISVFPVSELTSTSPAWLQFASLTPAYKPRSPAWTDLPASLLVFKSSHASPCAHRPSYQMLPAYLLPWPDLPGPNLLHTRETR